MGAVLRYAACLAAALGCTTAAHGQTAYPLKPIRLVAPFPPGGGTDFLARLFGQKMSETLSQQVVVDNRGGAGGTIGTDIVAKAPPDGYTIILVSASHAINPGLYPKLPYDSIHDFAPITQIATSPGILVVNPSLPVKTVKELIALARAKPGQINYASAGSGTPPHLAGELFKLMAKIDMVHVPYKGNAPAFTDVIGGQVSLIFPTMPSAMPFIKSGKLRPIAVTSAKRSPAAPDIPTIAESGLPGYEATSWYGILAPGRTPREIVAKLHEVLVSIIGAPDMKDKLAAQGLDPVGNTPQQFAAMIKAEIAKWLKVVKASGAKPE
ncbi:MAG TPA: tripartite tricarboxylate transporter substrate binding protein [Burkholderiales bacterium]|nr:tripartite tricarboxylate transporter substrate binding protein [Burkholderiales bacterium]